jgi:hypothetical protein
MREHPWPILLRRWVSTHLASNHRLSHPVGQDVSRRRHHPGRGGHVSGRPLQLSSRTRDRSSDERDFAFFGWRGQDEDQIGYIDVPHRAIFGRTYAAEPDELTEQLRGDEAIAEADTLLLTVPNQLGVDYNVHALESILTAVAPALGWR